MDIDDNLSLDPLHVAVVNTFRSAHDGSSCKSWVVVILTAWDQSWTNARHGNAPAPSELYGRCEGENQRERERRGEREQDMVAWVEGQEEGKEKHWKCTARRGMEHRNEAVMYIAGYSYSHIPSKIPSTVNWESDGMQGWQESQQGQSLAHHWDLIKTQSRRLLTDQTHAYTHLCRRVCACTHTHTHTNAHTRTTRLHTQSWFTFALK